MVFGNFHRKFGTVECPLRRIVGEHGFLLYADIRRGFGIALRPLNVGRSRLLFDDHRSLAVESLQGRRFRIRDLVAGTDFNMFSVTFGTVSDSPRKQLILRVLFYYHGG